MPGSERTIRTKFDGDADGLAAAGRRGERVISDFDRSVRKSGAGLGKLGAGAADDFVGAFGNSLRSGLPRVLASPHVTAGLAGVGVALAPTLGAGLAGAVVGGAGVGGVVGGLLLVKGNPEVQSAARGLKEEIGSTLRDAAQPFVPATVQALDTARQEFRAADGDFRRIFADSAEYLDPLAFGAARGARLVVSGIADAVEKAGPVIQVLDTSFQKIGGAVGKAFSTLADDAEAGASGVEDLTSAAIHLVEATTLVVDGLAKAKGATDEFDAGIDRVRYYLEDGASKSHAFAKGLDLTADGFKKGTPEAEAYRRETLGVATAADRALLAQAALTDEQRAAQAAEKQLAETTKMVSDAANQATLQATLYASAVNTAAGNALSAAEANLSFRQAVESAKSAVDGKRKVTLGEEQALLGLVRAANSSTEAMEASGATAEEASAAYSRQRNQLIAVAEKMGMSRGEARRYVDQLLQIPKNVNTKVNLDSKSAITGATNVQRAINNIKGKTVYVNVARSGEYGADDQGAMHGPSRRAVGGPVFSGRDYLVGERGPELLRMGGGGSGTVIPNGSIGGGTPNVTVYLGTAQITDILDVRVDQANRSARHAAKYGAR
ncbi:hypothetical protein O7635_05365 [Asanoa sp. WMMD1127]|uniref:hypothetical protein n=1 Tax=Asanoa sp. WMMD1127 TaxID=3016107 RepID=UPI00241714A1|nr:hypothetical protein [Asanoa sp. WMMD1127]MDG4821281.1 hypothetical protein [Asanoa sp. WMMD1127]